jgi:hypothetical protein
MVFQLSNERMEKMNNEAGCTFPKCECHVPSYALSMYNRTEFCEKLAAYEEIECAKALSSHDVFDGPDQECKTLSDMTEEEKAEYDKRQEQRYK